MTFKAYLTQPPTRPSNQAQFLFEIQPPQNLDPYFRGGGKRGGASIGLGDRTALQPTNSSIPSESHPVSINTRMHTFLRIWLRASFRICLDVRLIKNSDDGETGRDEEEKAKGTEDLFHRSNKCLWRNLKERTFLPNPKQRVHDQNVSLSTLSDKGRLARLSSFSDKTFGRGEVDPGANEHFVLVPYANSLQLFTH